MIKLYKTQHEYDTEEFTNDSVALDAGIPVVLSAGKLVANASPEYLTLEPCAASEERCLVHRIRKDELYSTLLSADGSALKVGDAVTLQTSGYATATKSGGIFKIEEFKDTVKGSNSVIVGRFI